MLTERGAGWVFGGAGWTLHGSSSSEVLLRYRSPNAGVPIGSAPVWTRLGDRHHNTTAFRSRNTKINRPICNRSALAVSDVRKGVTAWLSLQSGLRSRPNPEKRLRSRPSLSHPSHSLTRNHRLSPG